jgi:hypothetical protein
VTAEPARREGSAVIVIDENVEDCDEIRRLMMWLAAKTT